MFANDRRLSADLDRHLNDPIAYTYGADVHCPDCTALRFPPCEEHDDIACIASCCPELADSEGNEPHAVFWLERNENDDPPGVYCGDCGGEIMPPYEPPPADPLYRVRFVGYCGVGWDLDEGRSVEKDEAREIVAHLLNRRRRQGYPCTTLAIGKEWEIGEPEGCGMVPDDAGYVVIKEVAP